MREPTSSDAKTGAAQIAGIANGSSEGRPSSLIISASRVLVKGGPSQTPRKETDLKRFCGIDWAEDHHDVAVIDADAQLVIKRRITDDADGFAELLAMLESTGDTSHDPIPVAIETPRGLLVAALRATGRPVYAINPMAVARYRERH
jgi:hypothetical protein